VPNSIQKPSFGRLSPLPRKQCKQFGDEITIRRFARFQIGERAQNKSRRWRKESLKLIFEIRVSLPRLLQIKRRRPAMDAFLFLEINPILTNPTMAFLPLQ
jgi:hypothetical protein